jgi:hypothetical protein
MIPDEIIQHLEGRGYSHEEYLNGPKCNVKELFEFIDTLDKSIKYPLVASEL